MQPTPVGSERSLDTRSKLFAGGQLELGRALSAAFNVSVAERLKVARKSWRVDAFRANVRHMSFPGHLLTLSSPFRTRCWIQRSPVAKCRARPRPSRSTIPMAAVASLHRASLVWLKRDIGRRDRRRAPRHCEYSIKSVGIVERYTCQPCKAC